MKIFSWLGKHIGDVNVKDEPEGMNLPPTHQEWNPEALETDRERTDDDRQ